MSFESDLIKYNQNRSKYQNIKPEDGLWSLYIFGQEKKYYSTLDGAALAAKQSVKKVKFK